MKYSVVIPVFNESDSIELLFRELESAMNSLCSEYEILFVDDASDDDSRIKLKNICESSPRVAVICLQNRSGQAAALQAGFDNAEGDIIITLDGDLQNDPGDIPKLIAKLGEGYDVVTGWRYERQDSPAKKIMSRSANALRRTLTGETTHDVGCTLKVYKKEFIKSIYLSSGLHRYLTGLATKLGYKVGEVKVKHRHRQFGETKYGFWGRFFQGAKDMIKFWKLNPESAKEKVENYKVQEIIRKS